MILDHWRSVINMDACVFRVYVVNHRMPRGLFGWLLFYFMWPFRFTFGTLWSIFGFAS